MARLLFTPRNKGRGSAVESSSDASAAYPGSGRHGMRLAAMKVCYCGRRSAGVGDRTPGAGGFKKACA